MVFGFLFERGMKVSKCDRNQKPFKRKEAVSKTPLASLAGKTESR